MADIDVGAVHKCGGVRAGTLGGWRFAGGAGAGAAVAPSGDVAVLRNLVSALQIHARTGDDGCCGGRIFQ